MNKEKTFKHHIVYIRDNQIPIGCIISIDENHIGWSLCNPKDTFNKNRAKQIAYNRALKGNDVVDFAKHLPESHLTSHTNQSNLRMMQYVFPALQREASRVRNYIRS